jgi:hypothetical protein
MLKCTDCFVCRLMYLPQFERIKITEQNKDIRHEQRKSGLPPNDNPPYSHFFINNHQNSFKV